MKRIMILLALIAFICTVGFAQETEEQSKIKNLLSTIYDSSVSIFSIGKSGSAVCSGTIIRNEKNNTQILTAKHCSDTFEETYVDGLRVSYIISSENEDLAIFILKESIPDKKRAVFAKQNEKRNKIIYHIGFPEIDVYTSVGVTYLNGIDNSFALMKIIPGCSGGGLFNENGELIGVVFASIGFGEGLTVYEPISDVRNFLITVQDYLR